MGFIHHYAEFLQEEAPKDVPMERKKKSCWRKEAPIKDNSPTKRIIVLLILTAPAAYMVCKQLPQTLRRITQDVT